MIYATTELDVLALLDALVARFVGPWGVFFILIIVVYFMWRLFRESQRDVRTSESRVDKLTDAVRELTAELRAKR